MLNQQMLETLAEPREGPCVSIYSPTHDSSAEAEGDPIWLKTAVQDAAGMLKERDIKPERVNRLLQPARDFQADLRPNDFGAGTLCCLLADGFDEILHTPRQVQDNQVLISDRFHLKPLIPTLTENAHFYVLAISRHAVRLLQCTRYTQAEEPLSRQEVPHHILEAVPDVEPKKSMQQHSGNVEGQGQQQHEAMHHGQGKEERMDQHQVLHYFRDVNEGIVKYMNGRSPLIFAGVEELFDPYREANTYEHLVDEPVRGNPEHLRPEELRERAWQVLEPRFHERIAQAQENFEEALAYNRATDDMTGVVLSARDGRVATLFGAIDEQYWGRVPQLGDEVEMRAEPQPGDYDLIDYAAVQTMLQGGQAYLVSGDQVPGGTRRAAAILRY